MGVFLSLARDLRDEIKLLYFLTFIFMKYIFSILVATLAIVGTASAATGSTSTGSTSTGITTPKCVGICGSGGPIRGFNYTTNSWDMVPQCFPWVWLLEYYKGNIFDMYQNQATCRAQRALDFHL